MAGILSLGRCIALTLCLVGIGCDNSNVPAGGDTPTKEIAANDKKADAAGQEWQTQIAAVRQGASEQIQVVTETISDENLTDLDGLQGLTALLIDAGAVTDRGIPAIASIPGLEHLRLRESTITDAGVSALVATDSSLQVLNLPQAKLTANGIRELARLPNLVQLRIGGEQLDDEAARVLASLPALRSLHLIGPKLSDAGLDALAESPKLASFYLDDCELSDAAWERLFDAKPNLHVHINQAHHDRDPSGHEH